MLCMYDVGVLIFLVFPAYIRCLLFSSFSFLFLLDLSSGFGFVFQRVVRCRFAHHLKGATNMEKYVLVVAISSTLAL